MNDNQKESLRCQYIMVEEISLDPNN